MVYRAVCTHCHYAPEAKDGGLIAYVTLDGRSDGSILPGGYLAFRRDDGEVVPLPHPLEGAMLKENGGSWGAAARSGRLFDVTYKVCMACGTLHKETRVRGDDGLGCNGSLLTAIVTPLVCTLVFRMRIVSALGWACLMPYVFLAGLWVFYRIRWASANASMKLTQCSSCGGSEFRDLFQSTKRPMMCPNCKTRSMVYSVAGDS